MATKHGKLFYIYESPIDTYYPGVVNKIEQQVKVFSKYYDTEIVKVEASKGSKIWKRISRTSQLYRWDLVCITEAQPKCIYIRKVFCDSSMIAFLKSLKDTVKDCRVIIEIPTFPYDREQFASWIKYPIYLKDEHYRKQLKEYVDRIVTYSEDREIFGIETIRIQNGVDVARFPIVQPREEDHEIHLIAVASLQSYHGYERVIEGMYQYYSQGGKREIQFHIVGDGSAKAELVSLTAKYQLTERVIFWGKKIGAELTEIYNKADIGLDTFGSYKRGVNVVSSLKTREYLSRGLPVVIGCRESAFETQSFDYYLSFSNDNTPIDVQKIIDFYDRVFDCREKIEVFSEIRRYAEENVSISQTFAPVIDYLKES